VWLQRQELSDAVFDKEPESGDGIQFGNASDCNGAMAAPAVTRRHSLTTT